MTKGGEKTVDITNINNRVSLVFVPTGKEGEINPVDMVNSFVSALKLTEENVLAFHFLDSFYLDGRYRKGWVVIQSPKKTTGVDPSFYSFDTKKAAESDAIDELARILEKEPGRTVFSVHLTQIAAHTLGMNFRQTFYTWMIYWQ